MSLEKYKPRLVIPSYSSPSSEGHASALVPVLTSIRTVVLFVCSYNHGLALFASIKYSLIAPDDFFPLPGPVAMLSNEKEPLLLCRLRDERLGTSNTFMEATHCKHHFQHYWTAFQAACGYQPFPRENMMLKIMAQIVNDIVYLFGAQNGWLSGAVQAWTTHRPRLHNLAYGRLMDSSNA
jgi:hypothetical protein